ncbi:hypothetical protein [Roseinatronobacter sp. NSM]|uniref:hypothetical protein n=1 Tax=Roseinatronobacter sp. NSM TaxID=3457785 RepID=UPI0040350163
MGAGAKPSSFKKGEIADICTRHLDVEGEMTTRELAERVMVERDLDISGKPRQTGWHIGSKRSRTGVKTA